MSDVDPTPRTISRDALASPWRRLGAILIDSLIVGLAYGIVVAISMAANDKSFDPGDDHGWDWLWSLGWFIYQVVPTAVWGKTIGKHLLGIQVCSRSDLGRPGWLRSLKRWGLFEVIIWIPFVGGPLSLLIPLPLLWTANRQGLHDIFADTVVIRSESVLVPTGDALPDPRHGGTTPS